MEQAHADVAAIAARIRDREKRDRTFTIAVVPLLDQIVGDVRRPVLVLLGLRRDGAAHRLRQRRQPAARPRRRPPEEIAIRTALGASGGALARQLLTESLLLAAIGGAAGLFVAAPGLSLLRALNPGNIPRLDSVHIDTPVLAFTLLVPPRPASSSASPPPSAPPAST